jgi:hypothetical protein
MKTIANGYSHDFETGRVEEISTGDFVSTSFLYEFIEGKTELTIAQTGFSGPTVKSQTPHTFGDSQIEAGLTIISHSKALKTLTFTTDDLGHHSKRVFEILDQSASLEQIIGIKMHTSPVDVEVFQREAAELLCDMKELGHYIEDQGASLLGQQETGTIIEAQA